MGGNEGNAHHPVAAGEWRDRRPCLQDIHQANGRIATSGACATIASDALMNPFDGQEPQDGIWLASGG